MEVGGRGEVRVLKGRERKSDRKGNPLPDSGHSFFLSEVSVCIKPSLTSLTLYRPCGGSEITSHKLVVQSSIPCGKHFQ